MGRKQSFLQRGKKGGCMGCGLNQAFKDHSNPGMALSGSPLCFGDRRAKPHVGVWGGATLLPPLLPPVHPLDKTRHPTYEGSVKRLVYPSHNICASEVID